MPVNGRIPYSAEDIEDMSRVLEQYDSDKVNKLTTRVTSGPQAARETVRVSPVNSAIVPNSTRPGGV